MLSDKNFSVGLEAIATKKNFGVSTYTLYIFFTGTVYLLKTKIKMLKLDHLKRKTL